MAGGYFTPAAGNQIKVSEHTQYVRDQVVSQFASTTARDAAITSPVVGMVCYVKSNDSSEGFYTYTSAAKWQKHDWSAPWGVVGYAEVTANQGSITTVANLTSLTLAPTFVANRRVRTSAQISIASNAADDICQLQITDATPTVLNSSIQQIRLGTNEQVVTCAYVETTSAGATTRKLMAGRAGGSTGTFTLSASSTRRSFILIEDLGANGAPA